jgi:hypothetical protein
MGDMGFCDHCGGQRFDRAQVLRALRDLRKDLRGDASSDESDRALQMAIDTVRRLAIPHLEVMHTSEGEVIH